MNEIRANFSGRPAYMANTSARQGPVARLTPNPKLKFLDQCREVMRFK